MSRAIHPATLAAMSQPHWQGFVFARVDFDEGTLAINTSHRDRVFGGVTYQATGELGNISPLDEEGQFTPSRHVITISGIDDGTLGKAATINYLNKKAVTHVAVIDDDGEIIGEPFIWFEGLTDTIDISFGQDSRIQIHIRDRLADWARNRISRYTDAEQKRLFPDDKALEYINQVPTREVVWPAKTWFQKNA